MNLKFALSTSLLVTLGVANVSSILAACYDTDRHHKRNDSRNSIKPASSVALFQTSAKTRFAPVTTISTGSVQGMYRQALREIEAREKRLQVVALSSEAKKFLNTRLRLLKSRLNSAQMTRAPGQEFALIRTELSKIDRSMQVHVAQAASSKT